MKIFEYNNPVAKNISRIIKEKGLKQMFIAKKSGIGKQKFNDMINGRRIIKPSDVMAITDALGVEANDLFAEPEKGE